MKTRDPELSPKGAYVLLIQLDERLDGAVAGREFTLGPGLYAYCGSARGPGGLKARIKRHRLRDKKVHWHIDQVTTRAPVIKIGVSLNLSECELLALLVKQRGCSLPIPGFGSSDCRDCPSHFVKVANEGVFDRLPLRPLAL